MGCRALLLLLLAWPGIAQTAAKGKIAMTDDQLITIWLDSIDRVPADGYRPVTEWAALPSAVRGDATFWAGRFFTPEANPHNHRDTVQWAYHLATEKTPDILRYRSKVDSYELDVIETRGYLLVRVRRLLPPNTAAVVAVAEKVLLKPEGMDSWNFHFPAALVEGTRFSTNQDAGPLRIASWEDLVAGGIRNGSLYFLRCKKVLDRMGYPDLRGWFDNTFRNR
jgi:hypothetical protein